MMELSRLMVCHIASFEWVFLLNNSYNNRCEELGISSIAVAYRTKLKKQSNIHFGFTFDGNKVAVRSKTISKYYYRMHRKAKTIIKGDHYTKTSKHIIGVNLYRKYSERGSKGKKGNFLSYIDRAELEFGTDELIRRDVKRHMSKIRKAVIKKP